MSRLYPTTDFLDGVENFLVYPFMIDINLQCLVASKKRWVKKGASTDEINYNVSKKWQALQKDAGFSFHNAAYQLPLGAILISVFC